MSCGIEVPLFIVPGKTFNKPFRWGQNRLAYRQISAASQTAPCILTVTGHGMPDGWAYQIAGADGMIQLNTPKGKYRQAIVIDPNTVEINDLDASGFEPYLGGGILSYPMPVQLAGYTAAMHVRRNVRDTATLFELTSAGGGILINDTTKTITLVMTAAATAALAEGEAVYDIEMTSAGNEVSLLAYGPVTIGTEVTR